ncbi:hypothetical protein BH10PSE12_BH10PSE12_04770 [soil metagenome]
MNTMSNEGERALRERAYVLADGGECATVHQIEQRLIGEGWPNVSATLDDYARKAIAERCSAARAD